MLFVSVPGYNVNRIGKDHYAVALKNGNIGAAVIHKDDFDEFVKAHNGKDYRKTAKKVAVGLATVGLVTAGILLRKPIAETAKQVFEAVKNSNFVKKALEFVKDSAAKTKKVVQEVKEEFQEVGQKVGKKVRNRVGKKTPKV